MGMTSLAGIVAILAIPFLAVASPLGLAGSYNEFVLGNIDLRRTDSFGGVAAGGDVYFENVSVASKVAPPLATGDLLVGKNLFFDAGSVGYFPENDSGNLAYKKGSIITGGTATFGENDGFKNVAFGSLQENQAVDDLFRSAWDHLESVSSFWSTLPSNGTTQIDFGGDVITLTGSDPTLNIFSLDAADIGQHIRFEYIAPETSTILVNVAGATGGLQNFGFFFNGLEGDDDVDGLFPDERILYNFFEADFLEIAFIEVHGSVLAPWADVLFYSGHIEGNLIAQSLTGDRTGIYTGGEAHDEYFEGYLPYEPVPEPGTIFLAGGGLLLLALVKRQRWILVGN
jgi:choice-of-anchor A domain-containing protein